MSISAHTRAQSPSSGSDSETDVFIEAANPDNPRNNPFHPSHTPGQAYTRPPLTARTPHIPPPVYHHDLDDTVVEDADDPNILIHNPPAELEDTGRPEDIEEVEEIEDRPIEEVEMETDAINALARALDRLALREEVRIPKPAIPPPVFEGKSGENPTHHLLKAVDWFKKSEITAVNYSAQFVNTLTSWAREWYDNITVPAAWDDMKTMFNKEYSTQGKSTRQLLHRWRSLSFNPATDQITKFVSDCKQTAAQLQYGEGAVVELIKSCMPDVLYGALYPIHELEDVVKMATDFVSRQPAPAPAPAAAPVSTTPFARMAINPVPKQVSFNNSEIIDGAIESIKESLYAYNDDDGETQKQARPPWKPYVTPRKGRGNSNRGYRGNNHSRGNSRNQSDGQKNSNYKGNNYDPNYQGRSRTPDRSSDRSSDRSDKSRSRYRGRGRGNNSQNRSGRDHSRGRSYDRSPNNSRPRSSSKPVDKDNDRCHFCRQTGHWQNDCEELKDQMKKVRSQEKILRGNSLAVQAPPSSLFVYKQGDDGEVYFEQLNH